MVPVVQASNDFARHLKAVFNHQTSAIGFRPSVIGNQTSVFRHRSSVIGHRSSEIGHRPSVIGHRFSNIGHRSSDIGYRISHFGHSPTRLSSRYHFLYPQQVSLLARPFIRFLPSVVRHRPSCFGYRSSVIHFPAVPYPHPRSH